MQSVSFNLDFVAYVVQLAFNYAEATLLLLLLASLSALAIAVTIKIFREL